MSSDWLIVETLGPDGPHTVSADGTQLKDWSSLARARSSCGPTAASGVVTGLLPVRIARL
jgi:hypothetical protein